MYILQSIANKANAVWQTETLPMWRSTADKVIRQRMANGSGSRRYRLVAVKG